MYTILIAHRDRGYAEDLTTTLRGSGFSVIDCGGPWPPRERCIRCDKGYCPLTEGADLMIYDPELTAVDANRQRYSLAIDSAVAHPDIPLLLAWPAHAEPSVETLQTIVAAAPNAQVAPNDPLTLVQEVRTLLTGRALEPAVTARESAGQM